MNCSHPASANCVESVGGSSLHPRITDLAVFEEEDPHALVRGDDRVAGSTFSDAEPMERRTVAQVSEFEDVDARAWREWVDLEPVDGLFKAGLRLGW